MEKQAHYAMCEDSSEVEDELLLVAYKETNLSAQQENLFLDSGCSNHMTGNKQWFTKINRVYARLSNLAMTPLWQ